MVFKNAKEATLGMVGNMMLWPNEFILPMKNEKTGELGVILSASSPFKIYKINMFLIPEVKSLDNIEFETFENVEDILKGNWIVD